MDIKGQTKLINKINKTTLDSFPRSVILSGPNGSGKHLILNYVAEHLNLNAVNITNELSYEKIEWINNQVEPRIYFIEDVSVKDQNVILKFLEEPLKNAYIIILADNELQYLDTVLNRCQKWKLEHYSPEILLSFNTSGIEPDVVQQLCTTPGDVIRLQSLNIQDLMCSVNNIYDKIHLARYSNLFNVIDKLDWDNTGTGYDPNLFMRTMYMQAKTRAFSDSTMIHVFRLTSELTNSLNIPRINKKNLFENYIFRLKDLLCKLRN